MDEVLKPCPFCGGEADYHSEKGPTGEVYGWVGCNQCDAMSCYTDTRSMQPEETHPIDAWNTRADAAPTPKADEVEAVARAVHGELSRIDVMKYLDMPDDTADRVAQAAIAALDAAREDRVARVHRMPPGPDRWEERSRTFKGIAEAMADQWVGYVLASYRAGEVGK